MFLQATKSPSSMSKNILFALLSFSYEVVSCRSQVQQTSSFASARDSGLFMRTCANADVSITFVLCSFLIVATSREPP